MSLTDPRYRLLEYFDPSYANCKVNGDNLTLDDGSTKAKYEAEFEMGENRLLNLFHVHKVDLIFIIKRVGVQPLNTPSGPVGYTHNLVVQPVLIDKEVAGTRTLTAHLLLDKAIQEIRRIVRTNMSGSMRLTEKETSRIERLGSTLLYGDEVEVNYTQYVSSY